MVVSVLRVITVKKKKDVLPFCGLTSYYVLYLCRTPLSDIIGQTHVDAGTFLLGCGVECSAPRVVLIKRVGGSDLEHAHVGSLQATQTGAGTLGDGLGTVAGIGRGLGKHLYLQVCKLGIIIVDIVATDLYAFVKQLGYFA